MKNALKLFLVSLLSIRCGGDGSTSPSPTKSGLKIIQSTPTLSGNSLNDNSAPTSDYDSGWQALLKDPGANSDCSNINCSNDCNQNNQYSPADYFNQNPFHEYQSCENRILPTGFSGTPWKILLQGLSTKPIDLGANTKTSVFNGGSSVSLNIKEVEGDGDYYLSINAAFESGSSLDITINGNGERITSSSSSYENCVISSPLSFLKTNSILRIKGSGNATQSVRVFAYKISAAKPSGIKDCNSTSGIGTVTE